MKTIDFGKRLKELRTESGLTQQQLAARMGLSKSAVSLYECMERAPSPNVLIKLSAVFHVSTDYLLGMDKVKRIDVSGLSEEDIILVEHLIDLLRKKNAINAKQQTS